MKKTIMLFTYIFIITLISACSEKEVSSLTAETDKNTNLTEVPLATATTQENIVTEALNICTHDNSPGQTFKPGEENCVDSKIWKCKSDGKWTITNTAC